MENSWTHWNFNAGKSISILKYLQFQCSLESPCSGSPGRWGPKGMSRTGREGPKPACVRASLHRRWHTQERKGDNTCLAVVPSSRRDKHFQFDARMEDQAARKGKLTTVFTYSRMPWVTGKAGENGQNSGDGAARSSWTRPSAPRCGDASNALAPARSEVGIQGSLNLALELLSIGSPAGRTLSKE